MIESLRGEQEPSSPDHYRHKTRRAVHRHGAAGVVHTLDLTALPKWYLPTSPDAPRAGWAPDRPKMRHVALLTAIRRIAAIIRMWRRRAHSRQLLCELNDHLLKDIGVSRETACYEVGKPFWR